MLTYLLSALALGFVVAIPPGSVTIVSLQRSMTHGFKNSLLFIMGSSIADIFYITLVYYGVSEIILENYVLQILLYIFSGSLLFYIGISSIRNGMFMKDDKKTVSHKNSLFSGIGITLLNPVTVIGWIAIAGSFFLTWSEKWPESKNHFTLSVVFIMIGVLAWFVPLNFIVSRLRKFINNKITKIFIISSSILIILFGLTAYYSAGKLIYKNFYLAL